MAYFKTENDGYIICIGIGAGEIEIEEAEYHTIMQVIQDKPIAPGGYSYRLRTDLTWELCELPPLEESFENSEL